MRFTSKLIILIFLLFQFLSSCNFYNDPDEDFIVQGLKPIYGESGSLSWIQLEDSVNILQAGKIVYKQPYLFINEVDKGIHVINNQDPSHPVKEAFISIPFNKDLAVKGDLIYADNQNDLVVIRYHNKDSIKVVGRQKNVFEGVFTLPEYYYGYFECVDGELGDVIGWEEVELVNPECRSW